MGDKSGCPLINQNNNTIKRRNLIMEITREQFVKELATLGESRVFNVQSDDSGAVNLSLYG